MKQLRKAEKVMRKLNPQCKEFEERQAKQEELKGWCSSTSVQEILREHVPRGK